MTTMRYILQIIGKLYIGGAEKVARDIGLYAPQNYENHYVVFGEEVGVYEAELELRGCKVFHIPSPSESYPGFLRNLKQLMREYPYQAVHAHTMFSIGWAMLAAKQMGVPVRIAHAHSALRDGSGVVKTAYETAMRLLIRLCATDLIGCGVDAGNRLFGNRTFKKCGKLILNGIDTEQFAFSAEMRQRMRERLNLSDSFVIGHVGHLAEVKNQVFLLRMLPELRKRKVNAVLLLLGDGEDRTMLEAETERLGISERVIFTGNVNNVQDYLCAMDVFAFPSLYEGMPLSIVEVQANGLPCVISDRVPKDVFLTDLLRPVSLESADEWAEALCTVQRREPERYAEELKRAGFDVQTAIQKFYQLYERHEV